MSSLARRIQIRVMKKKGIDPVPVFGRPKGRILGSRYPLCPAHTGYDADCRAHVRVSA